MKVRKKAVEVEAMLFDGTAKTAREICDWANDDSLDEPVCTFMNYGSEPGKAYDFIVWSLEGDMTAEPGDYIIKGVNGEFYPIKPDIFDKTYDIID